MSSGQTKTKRHVHVFSAAACLAAASAHRSSHSYHCSIRKPIDNNEIHGTTTTNNAMDSSVVMTTKEAPPKHPIVGNKFTQFLQLRGGVSSSGDDYYEILGIHKTATSTEVKKAYRRKAVQTHPDKTPDGDRTEFDRVSEAYDVLSSEDKRTIYDRYGKAGLENGGGVGGMSGSFQEDILRSFFGGAGASPFSSSTFQNKRRSAHRNVKYQLEVTLEELYMGSIKKVSLPIPRRHQHTAHASYKKMEVTIPAGSSSGQRITLPGEIDYIDPNATPGDAIFILVQRPHRVFSRKQADLAMECEISLKESICGFQRKIVLLDGSEILVKTSSHVNENSNALGNTEEEEEETQDDIDMIHTNDVRVIQGVGMPTRNGERGDLFLQFKVIMPGEKKSRRAADFGSLSRRSNLSATGGSNVSESLTREERRELGRLLDKLNGISTVLDDKSNDDSQSKTSESIRILKQARASDFGKTKMGDIGNDDGNSGEEYLDRDDDGDGMQNPFFGSSRQFFSYSSGDGPRSSFFSGGRRNNSYGAGAEDNEEVQCQQM